MSDNKSDKSVGSILKEARVVKNISLDAASKHTKIHPNILKLMEADDFKSLGAVYAKSFLKLYGEYLGLDKEDLLRRFQNISGRENTSPVRRVRIPGDERPAPMSRLLVIFQRGLCVSLGMLKKLNFRLIFIFLLALLVVIGFVKFIKHHKRSSVASQMLETKKVPLKKSSLDAKAGLSAGTMPLDSARTFDLQEDSVSKESMSPAPKEEEKIVLVVRAKEKSWLQVKVDGKIVFQHVFAKGTAESWQATEKIELWMGNAGVFQLELNGKLLGKIGRPGQTLKHVVVTRAGLSIQK